MYQQVIVDKMKKPGAYLLKMATAVVVEMPRRKFTMKVMAQDTIPVAFIIVDICKSIIYVSTLLST